MFPADLHDALDALARVVERQSTEFRASIAYRNERVIVSVIEHDRLGAAREELVTDLR